MDFAIPPLHSLNLEEVQVKVVNYVNPPKDKFTKSSSLVSSSIYCCIIALSEFLERGGSLKILLNKYDKEIAKSSGLYKRLAYYKEKDFPIVVKETQAHPFFTSDPDKKEIHFTVADEKSYRIETDIEKRTAECNFNNPNLAKGITTFFDGLFSREDAKEIDLIKLFEDGDK